MNKVEGLGSLQGRSEVRRPRFAQNLEVQRQQAPSLTPQAQGTNRYQGVQQASQDSRWGQLADALGVTSNYMARKEEDNESEWLARKPALIQQIKDDRGNGLITAAQVGEIFPEMVPSLRWRLAEAMGRDWGKERAQLIALEIENDEHLQYDTEARQEYITRRRSEYFEEAGGDNDFWHGGAMSSFNKAMETWDYRWLERTANYHKQLATTQFKDEVTEAYLHLGPQALLDIDQEWRESGPLHHTTRNEAVVEAVIELASTHGPQMLDHIPDRFLNRETKQKINEARNAIAAAEVTRMRNTVWMEEQQRKERQRGLQIGILQRLADDPRAIPHFSEFADEPELWGFIENVANAGAIEPGESAHTARSIERQILVAGTTGNSEILGIPQGEFNQETLTDAIMYHPGINARDRVALINKVPELMQGHNLIRDEDVRSIFDTAVQPLIQNVLSGGINETLKNLLQGQSLVAKATNMFYDNIEQHFMDYMDEHGRWPIGSQKRAIVREVSREVTDWITMAGGLEGLRDAAGSSQSSNPFEGRTPMSGQPRRSQ